MLFQPTTEKNLEILVLCVVLSCRRVHGEILHCIRDDGAVPQHETKCHRGIHCKVLFDNFTKDG